MTNPILDKVRGLAAELFDVPAAQITADSTPSAIESWDSVTQLNLMLALEDEYGIKFEPEDLEKMQSIGQVANLVSDKLR